jgi:hypothetical protein
VTIHDLIRRQLDRIRAASSWRVRIIVYQLGAFVCLVKNHAYLKLGQLHRQAGPGWRSANHVAAVCTRCGALGLR